MSLKKFSSDYYSLMQSKNKIINGIFIIATIVSIAACDSALYIPKKENVAANSNIENLQKGRQIYISKCASCHTLRIPEKHTKAEWPALIEKMQPKAKITDEEKQLILGYLTKGGK